MNNTKTLSSLMFLLVFMCGEVFSQSQSVLKVNNADELEKAIKSAKAGDEIVLANGVWKDIEIKFRGNGTKEYPITLRAETTGKVTIEGVSNLKLGGRYLKVEGLHFKNGYTPSKSVISFKITKKEIANYCQVTQCVIEDYSQLKRTRGDHWVEFWGQHNQLDHCYLTGKSNDGPTIMVALKGNEHANNYHQIVNNHFGVRPRKGGPHGETLQIGDSYTSMVPAFVQVANNFFERCNGEVEIISNKSNYNEFRNNIFYKCEGSLVLRHGNYCTVDGNIFIGDDNSPFIGGIRVINSGHWITNNYFYNLKGEMFRSPLAVMNGVPKSPMNRYNQVTDVVVAHNSWVNCVSPWHISVGVNTDQKDVLPASEIRSARPKRMVVANNLIYNQSADKEILKAYDKVDGIKFENNVIDNQGGEFEAFEGIKTQKIAMENASDWYYFPSADQDFLNKSYVGFDFEKINKDILGNKRDSVNQIGASNNAISKDKELIDRKLYGTNWYSTEKTVEKANVIAVASGELAKKLTEAKSGDILELTDGEYKLDKSLVIDKKITLKSKDASKKATITFMGDEKTPLFEMNPNGNLILQDVSLEGKKSQYAFAPLEKGMSSWYNLSVKNSEIQKFESVIKAYKDTFADTIAFTNTNISSCANGLELNAETDDKGDYNVACLNIQNSKFENISNNVIYYYRGGYDESTIGGSLYVSGSSFTKCGKKDKSKILIKTRGIINVDISGNTFTNNPVEKVALLWGKKNNTHSNNQITKSGKMVVEENLKQKMMY